MSQNKRIALRAALIALAMVLSYLESFFPIFIAVPGVKLGLANIVTLIALYKLGLKDTITITIGRILLTGILFQNLPMVLYSIAGAACSIAAMRLAMNIRKLSVTGVSILGGVFHNVGQVALAAVLLKSGNIFYYLSVLLVTGTVAGAFIGIFAGALLAKVSLPDISDEEERKSSHKKKKNK